MGRENLIELGEWREMARAGAAPSDALLRKQYVPDSIKAAGERELTFTISTGAIDRDRDTLKVDGWKLDNYRLNPVVLWAHNYRGLPVAKAVSIAVVASALKATASFPSPEEYDFADTVFRLIQGGYLRATSVGFRPIKSVYNNERGGFDFEEQELLEFSVVPVPANPEALLAAKRAGIDLAPLKAWAEGVLDAQEPGLWVPKAAAARALALATGEPESVRVPAPEPATPPTAEPEHPTTKVVPALTPETVKAAIQAAVHETVGARVRRELGRLD